MNSHWQHHKIVRTNDYRDEGYEERHSLAL
ncbi:hypothetical protein ACSSVV_003252 [Marinobacter sp. MBR-105]|jgi:hypothetical protein